jgi:hypothetical protein
MRTSPTGHSKTAQTLTDIATDVAAAVSGSGLTDAEIAHNAGITEAELTALLAMSSLDLPMANTILSGLENPNKRLVTSVVAAPYNTVTPTAPTGTKTVGQTLTANTGTWIGDAVISYTYQWVRHASATSQTDGVNINGATASTYQLQAGDANKYISCKIGASNSAGTATAVESARTTIVGA